jgi:hypothetical protein
MRRAHARPLPATVLADVARLERRCATCGKVLARRATSALCVRCRRRAGGED